MSTVAPQMRPEVNRSHTFPSTSAQNTRRRRRDTFVERLLKDPMLQTMADIGKQEGAIKPLPAPQRARTINISEFQQYYRHFQDACHLVTEKDHMTGFKVHNLYYLGHIFIGFPLARDIK
ncbi:2530_t:CDS:2 [Funneliformis geosporum]|uniref:12992_t:CDS:1 n=1 Tax=Funneliformis geosporum TaxID=1117311 RepID=A0A9W4SF40_9GLOM|nr:12992_t:CDS:2 [Funneliformis geosporum]CAI2178486.1 2530_t:CDS:2 [Funneliformis geosporum]